MKDSPFAIKVQEFIQYASSELNCDTTWLHRHLDDFDGTATTPISVTTLFEAMHAIRGLNVWDSTNQTLVVGVRIKDSDGIKLDFPETWEDVFEENYKTREPPSINLSLTSGLQCCVLGSPSFSKQITEGDLFDRLRYEGLSEFALVYRTEPFDSADVSSGVWGRTLSAIWVDQHNEIRP